MSTKIFVNLPVKDLAKSMDFYGKIGFVNNPQFSDETAACMVLSEDIFVMLLTHQKFAPFTPKSIADAHQITEVINAISFESKDQVIEVTEKAQKAGGKEMRDPQDYGFMYSTSFADLDGHIWEPFWMDPSNVQ